MFDTNRPSEFKSADTLPLEPTAQRLLTAELASELFFIANFPDRFKHHALLVRHNLDYREWKSQGLVNGSSAKFPPSQQVLSILGAAFSSNNNRLIARSFECAAELQGISSQELDSFLVEGKLSTIDINGSPNSLVFLTTLTNETGSQQVSFITWVASKPISNSKCIISDQFEGLLTLSETNRAGQRPNGVVRPFEQITVTYNDRDYTVVTMEYLHGAYELNLLANKFSFNAETTVCLTPARDVKIARGLLKMLAGVYGSTFSEEDGTGFFPARIKLNRGDLVCDLQYLFDEEHPEVAFKFIAAEKVSRLTPQEFLVVIKDLNLIEEPDVTITTGLLSVDQAVSELNSGFQTDARFKIDFKSFF